MLGEKNASANIAVKNLETARKFYEGILELQKIDSVGQEVVVYKSGYSNVIVYQSQYAGTNQATAMTWGVGEDIESVVQGLKDKGVSFEHYDMPNTKLEGDIHVHGNGNMKVAWFKDPDGNILNLINE
jgi:catechol 2,3-dioxygenase-like lactoylglutathione lyase family enzyme